MLSIDKLLFKYNINPTISEHWPLQRVKNLVKHNVEQHVIHTWKLEMQERIDCKDTDDVNTPSWAMIYIKRDVMDFDKAWQPWPNEKPGLTRKF